MALSEFELARCKEIMEAFLEGHRLPDHVKDQMELSWKWDRNSIIVYEMRQRWPLNTPVEVPVAKCTWNQSRKHWKIYCQNRSLRWASYSPEPQVPLLEDFVKTLEEDEYAYFWG